MLFPQIIRSKMILKTKDAKKHRFERKFWTQFAVLPPFSKSVFNWRLSITMVNLLFSTCNPNSLRFIHQAKEPLILYSRQYSSTSSCRRHSSYICKLRPFKRITWDVMGLNEAVCLMDLEISHPLQMRQLNRASYSCRLSMIR